MIKINLLTAQKGVASVGGAIPSLEGAEGFGAVSEGDLRKQALTKLLFMCLFPAILFGIEMQIVPGKKTELASRQAILNQLLQDNEKAKKAAEEITKSESEQKKVQGQINSIESVRKGRLLEVKVLDSLQRTIPGKIWLQRIDYSVGKISMSGSAVTDIALTGFMDSLGKNTFFKDVNLVRSNEQVDEQTGMTVKKFEVSCLVEAEK